MGVEIRQRRTRLMEGDHSGQIWWGKVTKQNYGRVLGARIYLSKRILKSFFDRRVTKMSCLLASSIPYPPQPITPKLISMPWRKPITPKLISMPWRSGVPPKLGVAEPNTLAYGKCIWPLVPYATWWSIWKTKNDAIFNNKPTSIETTIRNIKANLWLWTSMFSEKRDYCFGNLMLEWGSVISGVT
ncbi:hypothetical protein IFM89_035147 [Coptis chinensis]|uniref:Uncharacterized protein n=1 Tax=Coptis chinensis TaxID=261450 RepID=A0A835MDC5_9MAGN|nr:hypothetical protein IFM89_035147 [Coptis chinensis]